MHAFGFSKKLPMGLLVLAPLMPQCCYTLSPPGVAQAASARGGAAAAWRSSLLLGHQLQALYPGGCTRGHALASDTCAATDSACLGWH